MPDKFARGLDVAGVQHVFLLSPPSSAAGYMHLAGRTGRNGQPGHAITIVHPTEVGRLAVIVERLAVTFNQFNTNTTVDDGCHAEQEHKPTALLSHTWSNLSNSQLSRKTIFKLAQVLLVLRTV